MQNQHFVWRIWRFSFFKSGLIIYISRNLRKIDPSFAVILDLHLSKKAKEKIKWIRMPVNLAS